MVSDFFQWSPLSPSCPRAACYHTLIGSIIERDWRHCKCLRRLQMLNFWEPLTPVSSTLAPAATALWPTTQVTRSLWAMLSTPLCRLWLRTFTGAAFSYALYFFMQYQGMQPKLTVWKCSATYLEARKVLSPQSPCALGSGYLSSCPVGLFSLLPPLWTPCMPQISSSLQNKFSLLCVQGNETGDETALRVYLLSRWCWGCMLSAEGMVWSCVRHQSRLNSNRHPGWAGGTSPTVDENKPHTSRCWWVSGFCLSNESIWKLSIMHVVWMFKGRRCRSKIR